MATKESDCAATLVNAHRTKDGKLIEMCVTVQAYKASDGSLHLTQDSAERRSRYIAGCNALAILLEKEFMSTRNDREDIQEALIDNAKVLANILKDIANGQEAGKDKV